MSDPTPTLTAEQRVAAVLAAHCWGDDTERVGHHAMQCGCGWTAYETGSIYTLRERHDAHRAEALARMVADAEQRGRAEVSAALEADRHPEDYCHRCDGPNISWFTPGGVWDPVMRPVPGAPWKWNEIICPLCFVELAGGGTWALIPRKSDGEAWTSADERARIKAEALYAARDALYCGEGPDLVAGSDIVYGEWLGNRADRIGGDA